MTLWIAVGAVAACALWCVAVFNRVVTLSNELDGAWRQIDASLKRRHDLIPNLVETVKGHAAHEAKVLEQVVAARSGADLARRRGDRASVASAESVLGTALAKIDAVVEAYPELKASERFGKLRGELGQSENQLAAARRVYNASAENFNTAIAQVPVKFIATLSGFRRSAYFD